MESVVKSFEISDEGIAELADLVATGKSIALIGARDSGKRWLLSRLYARLVTRGLRPLALRFAEDAPESEAAAVERLAQQLKEFDPTIASFDDIFRCLHRIAEAERRPVIILAINIDGLERETARTFLRKIRTGVNAPHRWLTAVISGKSTIYSMVSGPDSVFNCAYEYVLQGMERSLFESELRRWCGRLQIELYDQAKTVDEIYRMVGGSFSLARRFLQTVVDRALNETDSTAVKIGPQEVADGLEHLLALGPFGAAYFQQAAEMVAGAPDCWPSVLELLNTGRIRSTQPAPSVLELAGVVHRRQGYLEFSSPLMREYFERSFGTRQRGDLEALAGNFEAAFKLYREGGSLARPTGLQDELVVGAIVRRLSAAFRGADLDRLRLSVQGALVWVLGFQRVGLLDLRGGRWLSRDAPLPERLGPCLEELKPAPGQIHKLVANGSLYGFAVPLIGTTGEHIAREAVAVWEPLEGHPLTASRAALAVELLLAFSDAHRDIWLKELAQLQIRLQARVNEIAADVVSGLFVTLVDPADVLRKAADDLLIGGEFFRRSFLVERRHESGTISLRYCSQLGADGRVRRLETSNESPLDLARLSELFPRLEDLVTVVPSQQVLKGGAPDGTCVIVRLGHVQAFEAVLVLESLHVAPPWESLTEPLEVFGRHLKAALEHSKRLALLSKALDRIADPILLFDMKGSVVYANEPARKLLDWPPKEEGPWFEEPHLLEAKVYDDLLSYVNRALKEGHRIATFVDQIDGKPYQGIIVSDTIKYKEQQAAGILVHIPDQQYYAELVRALQALEGAHDEDDALKKLAQIFQKQGHHWIRHYRVEGDELKPAQCIDSREEVARDFSTVQLPRRGAEPYTWLTIEEGRPSVFHFSNPSFRPGDRFFTPRGLEVIHSSEPPEHTRLGKRLGDYWIDFPLMAGSGCIGKFTLPCDENLSPERLEMLRVFAGIAGDVLLRIRDRLSPEELAVRRATRRVRKRMLAGLQGLSVALKLIEEAGRSFPEVDGEISCLKREVESLLLDAREGLARSEAAWRN